MRSSVRGGSKVVKGTRRRRRRRAEHEPPPPSGDGGTGLSVWSLPLPARPLACASISRAGPVGAGALPLVYVRCCWPSHCSPVGHGIKALRGRLRRGSFRAPGALAWIRPLRPFGRFAALTPRPCRSGWRLRSGLQRGRSVQRKSFFGGGRYVGLVVCGVGVAVSSVGVGVVSVAGGSGGGGVRGAFGVGALRGPLPVAGVPVSPSCGGRSGRGGGVRSGVLVPGGSALPCGVVGVAFPRVAAVSGGAVPPVLRNAGVRSGAFLRSVGSCGPWAGAPCARSGVFPCVPAGSVPWLPCVVWRGSSSVRRWSGSRAPGFPGARFASRPGGRVRRFLRAFPSPWGVLRGWMRSFVGRSPGPPCSRSPPVGGAPAVGRSPGVRRPWCRLSLLGACWWCSLWGRVRASCRRLLWRLGAGAGVARGPGRLRRSLWGSAFPWPCGLRRFRGSSLRFRSVAGGGGSGRGPPFFACAPAACLSPCVAWIEHGQSQSQRQGQKVGGQEKSWPPQKWSPVAVPSRVKGKPFGYPCGYP